MLKDELQAAYIARDWQRIVELMAANDYYRGDVEKLLEDFGGAANHAPAFEPSTMYIDGYPVQVKGTFSLAVVEYIDGTRRAVFRGEPKVFQEAYDLLEQEAGIKG